MSKRKGKQTINWVGVVTNELAQGKQTINWFVVVTNERAQGQTDYQLG